MVKVILAIAASLMIAVVILVQIFGNPNHHQARPISVAEITALSAALESFKADHGYYPSNTVYISALIPNTSSTIVS